MRRLMKLGGNDPLIVLPDADLAATATAISQRFEIAGQSCAAVKKLCIHRDVLPEFTEILLAGVVAHRCGDPSLTDTQMGPVIDRTAG